MTSVVSADQLMASIRQLLAEIWADAGSGEPMPELDDTANLFDLQVVDSFSILEIVTHVEETTGVMIDFTTFDPELFFTLEGIRTYIESVTLAESPSPG